MIDSFTERLRGSAAVERWANRLAWIPAFLFVLAFAPTVFSVPMAKGIDASMFYSIFHQLSQGRRLYADIFDMKDPLYFYGYGIAYVILGLRGPMIWETVLSVALLVLMDRIMAHLGLTLIARLTTLMLFVFLFFTPDVYMPIHTYHQAIVFYLAAVWAGLAGRPLIAGALIGLVFFSKMPMVYVLPACGWLAVCGGPIPRIKNMIMRLALSAMGFFGVVGLVLAVLVARGEFWGYLDSIGVNVYYSGLYPHHIFSPITFNKAVLLFGYGGVGMWLVLIMLDTILACYYCSGVLFGSARDAESPHHWHWLRRLELRWPLLALSVFSLALSLGTLYTISIGPKRSHHFQLVGVAMTVCMIHLFCYVRMKLPQFSVQLKAGVVSLVITVLTLFAPEEQYEVQHVSPATLQGDAVRFDARFVLWRDIIARYAGTSLTYCVVAQGNPGVRIPALTPPHMRLACRTFFQLPWNYPPMMDELISFANEGRADLFFRQNYFNTMPYYERQIDDALNRNYTLVETNSDVKIWRLRTGVGITLPRTPRHENPPLPRLEKAARALSTAPATIFARIWRCVKRRPGLPALAPLPTGSPVAGFLPTNTIELSALDIVGTDLDLLVNGVDNDGVPVVRSTKGGQVTFKLMIVTPCGARLSVAYGAGLCQTLNVTVNDSNIFTNVGMAATDPGAIHARKEAVLGDIFFFKPGVKHITLRREQGPFPPVAGIIVRATTVSASAPRR